MTSRVRLKPQIKVPAPTPRPADVGYCGTCLSSSFRLIPGGCESCRGHRHKVRLYWAKEHA